MLISKTDDMRRLSYGIFQNGTSNGSPKYSYNNEEFLRANGKTHEDCDYECEYFFSFAIIGAVEPLIN